MFITDRLVCYLAVLTDLLKIFYGVTEDTELLKNVFDITELEKFPRPVLDTVKLYYPGNSEKCEFEERLVICNY